MQNERIVSYSMVLYNQFKGIDLNGGVKAHTYSFISKAFLLYFPTGIFYGRFLTPTPPYVTW